MTKSIAELIVILVLMPSHEAKLSNGKSDHKTAYIL